MVNLAMIPYECNDISEGVKRQKCLSLNFISLYLLNLPCKKEFLCLNNGALHLCCWQLSHLVPLFPPVVAVVALAALPQPPLPQPLPPHRAALPVLVVSLAPLLLAVRPRYSPMFRPLLKPIRPNAPAQKSRFCPVVAKRVWPMLKMASLRSATPMSLLPRLKPISLIIRSLLSSS